MSERTHEQIAREGIEWCEDWRNGLFTPAHTADGWTVEMHGLVADHEQLAHAYLALTTGA
jgi:hypothetical protein